MNLSDEGANALFTGMVTDSGRFRYSSVSSKTFDSASFLMRYKVQLDDIYTKLYTDKLENVLLKARMTLKFEILDCGVAFIKNTYQDVLETGMSPYSLARSIVNNMAGIREISGWATFTELEDGKIIIELRYDAIPSIIDKKGTENFRSFFNAFSSALLVFSSSSVSVKRVT